MIGSLTDQDIADAREIAETSAEALARYDRAAEPSRCGIISTNQAGDHL
jgi:hypothetical protein